MEFNFDMQALVPLFTDWGIKIVLALLIYIVGKWIAKRITGFIGKIMQRADMDETLVTFLSNLVYAILLAAVILAALDKLGVPVTSLLAILGAAGLPGEERSVPIDAGQTLSHYKLIEEIGKGGMGVVWKAVDTTLDREIAVKVLPDTFSSDPERLVRFEREARAAAAARPRPELEPVTRATRLLRSFIHSSCRRRRTRSGWSVPWGL